MMVLTGHGVTAPLTPSREPIPICCVPFSVLNDPPTMTCPLLGWTTIVETSRFADGFHGRIAPVVAFAAASRPRAWNPVAEVPTVEKSPPK